jgi:hypothetical protein
VYVSATATAEKLAKGTDDNATQVIRPCGHSGNLFLTARGSFSAEVISIRLLRNIAMFEAKTTTLKIASNNPRVG